MKLKTFFVQIKDKTYVSTKSAKLQKFNTTVRRNTYIERKAYCEDISNIEDLYIINKWIDSHMYLH